MTNESKAKEIANRATIGYGPNYLDVAEEAALEMAEWKDTYFKEYLEKKHEEFTIKGTFENSYDWGRRSAIEEIISELFKEE